MLKEKKKMSAFTPFSKGLRKGCALFGAISLLFVLLCFPVSAAQNSSNTFILSCGRPSTSPGTGYVEILIKDSSNKLSVRTFMWSLSDSIGSVPDSSFIQEVGLGPEISIVNNSSGNDGITFYCPRVADGVKMDIYTINNANAFTETSIGYDEYKTNFTYTTGQEIVSYHLYGQYDLSVSGTFSKEEFYVLYAENGVIYNAITKGQQEQTNQIISGQQQQTDDIVGNQNQNTDKITHNQNSNTDKITENQDKNTQDVIDNQNQLVENERNEANTTGNKGVSDVLEIIPNDSESLSNAFHNLISCITTTNTIDYIVVPEIKIPTIKGFFEGVTLLPTSQINIDYVLGLFPEVIIILLRSFFTICLIIYCYKELYSLISYVLTLKGGSSDE